MKKDKEYLQSVIQRRIDNLPSMYEGLYIEGSRDAYDLVLQDIDQLDEPEVLSQEWIERNTSPVDDEGRLYIWKRDLENLIIPKQELPVEELTMTKLETLTVPAELGEWLQSRRTGDSGAYFTTIDELYHYWESVISSPTGSFITDNKKELIEVILGNREYEVEGELKYNVQLKPKSSFGTIGLFLYKLGDEVLVGDNFEAYYPEKDKFRLTELEIKDFDPRYWAFAKPVEEVEE